MRMPKFLSKVYDINNQFYSNHASYEHDHSEKKQQDFLVDRSLDVQEAHLE